MADNITPYIIRIQTALEKGGIQGAKDELAALSSEVDKAKGKTAETSKNSEKLGQTMGRAAELTGSLTAAMAQGSPEAQQLGAGLRVLKAMVEGSSAGFMGLATVIVGAGLSALVAYNNKVAESKKKILEFTLQLQDNARATRMSHLSDLTEQHEKHRAAIDAESDAYNRLSSARAAVDNAEKGARLADITLAEKQAQLALAPGDEAGAAKVSAEFARQRRDLENEYAVKEAKRAAEQKERDLAAARERLENTRKQEAEIAYQRESTKAKVLALSQEKVDLFGDKAPMREQVDTRMGPGGIPITTGRRMVVDEEKRERRIKQINNELQGSQDAPGLTEMFGQLSDDLAALAIKKAKEKIEAEALQIESAAANKNLSTVSIMNPKINAVETAADERKVRETAYTQNESVDAALEDLSGKLKGASSETVRAFQDLVWSSEQNGQLTVTWIKNLEQTNKKIFQQLSREIEASRNADRLRQ